MSAPLGAGPDSGPPDRAEGRAPGADSTAGRLRPSEVVALVPFHDELPRPELLAATARRVGRVIAVDDRPREGPSLRAPGVEVVRVTGERHGKGLALATGIRRAGETDGTRAGAVLMIDADGQHPPETIPAFLAAAGTADLVIGDRLEHRAAMPLERRLSNLAARRLLALAARRPVGDTQCGMRLLTHAALGVPFPSGGYESETRHLKRCLQEGLRVAWVPIPAIYGDEGSGFRRITDTYRVLRAILA